MKLIVLYQKARKIRLMPLVILLQWDLKTRFSPKALNARFQSLRHLKEHDSKIPKWYQTAFDI